MVAFWEKLLRIDKRVIYIIMLFAMALPMFFTFGLPISIQQASRDAFAQIDSLSEGDIVWIGSEMGPSQESELSPMFRSLVRHLLDKKARIVIGGFWSQGPTLAIRYTQSVFDEYGAVYGVDYVNIGYRTSMSATLDSARHDFHEAFANRDINNTPFSELPLMADVRVASDIDLVIAFDVGSPGTDDYIAAWQATGDVMKMFGAVAAVEIPNQMVKYNAGLLKGVLGGMSGAAQYEAMLGIPDTATKGMDSQGLAHLVIIIFIILGNIGYMITKNSPQKSVKEG